jgi:hypothetical protein
MRGDATHAEDGSKAAHSVCPTAKAKYIDAISWLPHPDDLLVAVNNIFGDPEASSLTHNVAESAVEASKETSPLRNGAETWVIACDLKRGINRRIWTAARCPEQLVNVAPPLVKGHTTSLAGAIGENQYVLGHYYTSNKDRTNRLMSESHSRVNDLTESMRTKDF